jgi:hypothetical protein
MPAFQRINPAVILKWLLTMHAKRGAFHFGTPEVSDYLAFIASVPNAIQRVISVLEPLRSFDYDRLLSVECHAEHSTIPGQGVPVLTLTE